MQMVDRMDGGSEVDASHTLDLPGMGLKEVRCSYHTCGWPFICQWNRFDCNDLSSQSDDSLLGCRAGFECYTG